MTQQLFTTSLLFLHSRGSPVADRVLSDDPMPDRWSSSDACQLPKDIGPCRAYVPSFYYDSRDGSCKEFIYGGCGGNANRFETAEQCSASCPRRRQQGRRELSGLPVADESGRVAHEQEARLQEDESNGTPPDEQDDHLNDELLRGIDYDEKKVLAIQKGSLSPYTLPELCGLPEEHGSCFDDILRWRFDPEKKSCTSFMYGGCDMNANHFTSEEDCERACGSWRTTAVCDLPPEVGNCEASVNKWYYDKSKDACSIMFWSGCGGNGNRFSSREDCESLCREESNWKAGVDVCKMPRSSGPCRDAISMWYFDVVEQTCKQFTYSGCRGNENRFETRERCERRCIEKRYDGFSDQEALNVKNVSAELRGNSDRPYTAGAKIELTCDSNGVFPILWMKDGVLLEFSSVVQEHDRFRKVTIFPAAVTDSGEYRCAVGPNGLLSNGYVVKVIAPARDSAPECTDSGTEKTCALIVRNGLCAKKRYSKFCCHSCRSV